MMVAVVVCACCYGEVFKGFVAFVL
eukprot:COSAG06_NODE_54842_length_292_cov_1.310881_1_plen_24_part_10